MRARRLPGLAPRVEVPENPLRLRIWRAVEAAHERACRFQSLDAAELAHLTATIARAWPFRRADSAEELHERIKILTHLHLAMVALERLETAHD
jgi:hypothetical protein